MHTRASNPELVVLLPEPEQTLNQRLYRKNRRVLFEQRNNQPQHPRIVYPPISDINYFRHFVELLNHNTMDDQPMWDGDCVVALTPNSAITLPATVNEFAIKGPSKTDTERIMARMDAITMKMDAQYRELQSQSKQSTLEENDDDLPISREQEEKFMQTFHLKVQLETVAKNHQASIQNLETKFDRLAEKQSSRPSGSLPSNTHPNPRGNNSKAYQPLQSRNEHVNVVFTQSGKTYDSPINTNEQQGDAEIFDSDDENEEPTPQPKPQPTKETQTPKPYKPKIPYPQRLRKEKMEAQYQKFLDIIRVVRINVPLVDVLAGMPNYGKFLKDLISNKNKIEQISVAFLSDESSAMIQNKVPTKTDDPGNEILEKDFDALLDEGSQILHSIKGTILEEKVFAEFDEFIAMATDENTRNETEEEPEFEKITINTDYKIKTSLEEPPVDLELKPLPDNFEYVFLEEL
ncbi:hypothetical protein Tco_1418393 [Tanacetum coccineum]